MSDNLDAKYRALLIDDIVLYATHPRYVRIEGGSALTLPNLVLTDKRLVVAKDRLFRPRLDYSTPWSVVGSVSSAPWTNGIQLIVLGPTGRNLLEIIADFDEAGNIESAIRACYLKGR